VGVAATVLSSARPPVRSGSISVTRIGSLQRNKQTQKNRSGSLPPGRQTPDRVYGRARVGVARFWSSEGQIAPTDTAREPGVERLALSPLPFVPPARVALGYIEDLLVSIRNCPLSNSERQIGLI
jgi:hypothetical protein